ncbi:unnamed protein product [Cyprideis torosa]|uniref:General vesicular transport factor p115 n=1 Tax=Cyprideis torosa TaxID=163714 RepID=A0A7R8W0U4_9CRUS|nr:unnamed protein product [Cyprideis torosa]CAG0879975.1 unnamed protein product [Cyprideis torosa]
MELLRTGFKTVLGTPTSPQGPSGAETVERLLDRVQSSTLLDDRRDGCRGLKALSKKYRMEVGAQGLSVLIQVLEMDRTDPEIVSYALDTLCNITSADPFDEELTTEEVPAESLRHLGENFTEMFIKRPENVALVLNLLDETDFRVRWPIVKFITQLLTNRPKELQDCILVCPMGVSKLMDLLSDAREVIRNDTLLLLNQLTKGNANLQKIVAFENAFDRIFDVMEVEGFSDGGVVVEDCLLLLLNLLKNNPSNQSFFKEGSYVQRIVPFFNLTDSDEGWPAQKVANAHLMLQVVRTLVSPSIPQHTLLAVQTVMHSCGLLKSLCVVLMMSGVPAEVLTETLNTVAEVIRGCRSSQEQFGMVTAPTDPPRQGADGRKQKPAVVVLLMSMVNEKQPFALRCAVLYCFQCYLFKYALGQSQVVQTLLPASADASASISAGQLLCGGVFSTDPSSNWLASVALLHCLVDNAAQKEQLLRVQLATGVGSPPISLLEQTTIILQQSPKPQTRLGILMLLCVWLSHCSVAVAHFLAIPANVPYLTAQVGSNESDDNEDVCQSLCAFLLGITVVFNDNSVENATPNRLMDLIRKRVGLERFAGKLNLASRHESFTLAVKSPQFKFKSPADLLLDHEFCRLYRNLESSVTKALGLSSDVNSPTLIPSEVTERLKSLEGTASNLQRENERLREENSRLQQTLNSSPGGGEPFPMPPESVLAEQLNQLRQINDELQHAIMARDNRIQELEQSLSLRNSVQPGMEHLTNGVAGIDLQASGSAVALDRNNSSRVFVNGRDASADLSSLCTQLDRMQVSLRTKEQELEILQKDHEDLLELMADYDVKMREYKKRLKAHGETVALSDSEEEEGEPDSAPSSSGMNHV